MGASILVTAALPLFLAIAIKVTSSGPIIFRRKRAGLHGRRSRVYKFRTMVRGAESVRDQVGHLNDMMGTPVFRAEGDPRLTGLSRLLRKLSLDDFPSSSMS